jgi:hypothetical protein
MLYVLCVAIHTPTKNSTRIIDFISDFSLPIVSPLSTAAIVE